MNNSNNNNNNELNVDVVKRIKQGQCPRCGVPTHKLMLGGLKKVPLDNANVTKGRCLSCNPIRQSMMIPPVVHQQHQHNNNNNNAASNVPRYIINKKSTSTAGNRLLSTTNHPDNRMSDGSMSSEMSEITMQTWHTKQQVRAENVGTNVNHMNALNHRNGHNHTIPKNNTSTPTPAPVPMTPGSVRSFSQDPYWDSTHSNSVHTLDKNTNVNVMQEMDSLPGEDEDDSSAKKVTLIKRVTNNARRRQQKTTDHEIHGYSYDPMNLGEVQEQLSSSSLAQSRPMAQSAAVITRDTSPVLHAKTSTSNRYARMEDNKIRIEEPVNNNTDQPSKSLPLFGGNQRRGYRDRQQQSQQQMKTAQLIPSENVIVSPARKLVDLEKRESDTEPPLEDPKMVTTTAVHSRVSKAPTMRRSIQAMSKENTSSRPRATVPGVVRENMPASRATKKMTNNAPSAAYTRSIHHTAVTSSSVVEGNKLNIDDDVPEHIRSVLKRIKTMTRIPEIVQAMYQYSDEAKVQEIGCTKFRNLSAHSSYVSGVRDVGGIEIIIRAMDRHLHHIGVQEQGCAALWCLAVQSKGNKEEIQTEGGVATILTAMKSHANEVNLVMWGCGALYSISFHQDSKVMIGSSGGVEIIVDAMRTHPLDSGVQESGILALCVICDGSQSNLSAAVSSRGVDIVMNSLKTKSKRLRVIGCKLLAKFASSPKINIGKYVASDPFLFIDTLLASGSQLDSAVNILSVLASAMSDLRSRSYICKVSGFIDVIADLILAYENNGFIHEKGMFILCSAAASGDCTHFKESSSIDAILVVLNSRSIGSSLTLDATNLLICLISFDMSFSRQFRNAGGLQVLLSILRKLQSSQVQEGILTLLSSLVTDDESATSELLASPDAMKVLVRMMDDRSSIESIQTRCCALVYSISCLSKGKRYILDQGLLIYTVNSMRTFRTPLIQELACNIIWNLSTNLEAAVEALNETDGFSQLLIAATETNELQNTQSSFNPYSEAACSAIYNLSENSVVQQHLQMLDAVDAFLNIATAFQGDANVQEKAIGILSNLCNNKSNADALRKLNGIRTIVRSANAHAHVKRVQEIICVALRNLALSSPMNLQAVCNNGGVDVVISAILNNKDENVRSEACACLRALSNTSSTEVKGSIVKAGGIDALMEIMDDHPENEVLQTDACATIPLLSGAADFQIVLVPRSPDNELIRHV